MTKKTISCYSPFKGIRIFACVPYDIGGTVPTNNDLETYCTHAFKRKISLCPFAVYYLRYAVRPLFTMSRISHAEGKRAGQKIQRKIAAAVQKVKSPVLFIPLF
jgi:hypothetical protein